MSAASLAAMQAALYSALTNAGALTALVSTRIYDHVPEDTAFPYVEIGEVVATPSNDKTVAGLEQAVTLHVWSRYRGRKETKQILDAIYQTLERSTLSVSGNSWLLARFVSGDTFRDQDGLTYHGVATYDLIATAA